MHSHSIDSWSHGHAFLGEHHHRHERRMWSVVALTALMMLAEIVGGSLFGSIALVADGWHMATHVAAFGIAGLAYLFARRHAHDTRFSAGTGKVGELAGFASAVILAMIALGIGYEAVTRLLSPVVIHFQQAIPIASDYASISPAPGCCATSTTAIMTMSTSIRGITIMIITMIVAIITTPICAPPISMCWRTP